MLMLPRLLNLDTALLTPRTVVRRFREGDGEALYNLMQDNYSRLNDHFPKTLQAANTMSNAELLVRRWLAQWHLQEGFSLGIWLNETAALIGMVRVFHVDWDIPKAELLYWLDKEHTQLGLMTECLGAVLPFAFEQLAIEKLSLRTAMDNVPSQRLARKCGFRREGDLRADFRKMSGELIDTMLFGLTRSEFLGTSA